MLCAFVGGLAFWIFVAHCLTSDHPFLNPRLLLDRNFAVGTLIAFVMGMLNFTSLVLFPSLLHDLRGYPDNIIGMLIAARGIGNWTAFLFIVQLTRAAPRLAVGCGLAIQAAGGFWMAQFDINLTEADVFWSHFLMGLGQSVAFTPMTMMAFATLPRHQITEGSAVFTMMRNFGSSLFISMAVLVLVRSTAVNYARMTEFIAPYRRELTFPGLSELLELQVGDRPTAAVERDPPSGRHDRLRECVLPDGLYGAGGSAARMPAAQRRAGALICRRRQSCKPCPDTSSRCHQFLAAGGRVVKPCPANFLGRAVNGLASTATHNLRGRQLTGRALPISSSTPQGDLRFIWQRGQDSGAFG